MRIVLVADGRSPITRRWVRVLADLGHQTTLISTFPSAPVEGVEADVCLPVAFAQYAGSGAGAGNAPAKRSGARKIVSAFRPLLLGARYRLGPLTLRTYGPRLRWLVERIQPDLVHALRIPYEGFLASYTPPGVPLIVSIWGNDLTLHANGSSAMAKLTRHTLARADGLMTDAARDVRLARAWGFDEDKPALVVPGSGGLDLNEIAAVKARMQGRMENRPDAAPLVINPRGFRTGSVRQDTFFASIPLVLERLSLGEERLTPGEHRLSISNLRFVCAAMAGQREALQMLDRYNLRSKVELLPHMPQAELWELFARAAVTVSISQHDGTPNSLLEAMALGAFPIAGDIESIREWITPGVNGLLVEPDKPQALAEAILLALETPNLRARAAEINARIVRERAEIGVVREKIQAFYEAVTHWNDRPSLSPAED